MIPYFQIDRFPSIFGVKIHVFGILVATGILVGSKLTRDRGRELGLPDEKTASMITTILVCGFLFSHFFDVFAYQLSAENAHLTTWEWVKLWLWPFSGISSYGGFMGAVGGLFWWCRKNKQDVMPYADSLGYGLAAGWFFGRCGCFTAHDHPGALTDFWMAVQYPGGARHDLGLYEAIWALGVTLLFAVMKKMGRQRLGIYVTILVTAYGPVRFALDFLRATDVKGADPRYFGLTPAHYLSIVTLVAGIGLAIWTARWGGNYVVPALPEPEPEGKRPASKPARNKR